ncbi:HlyD family efflux transporter periplasmic adaptor subunit [Luteimonas sp. Y-2-2-4F]|nr:HlyD family efflux transporter periplasmic adaptor subunit [Luteimonas sp. Y-2-2-4F]MCD9030379.1 HlyD family efflux transporter periplasmic adaptor subunit [Luteimonas sp. Y-2-2-4F]
MDIVKPSTASKWRRFPRPWIAALAVLALVAFAVLGMGRAMPSATRSELWIDVAEQGDMRREIRANGTLVPRHIRWIVAGATATVQQVEVLAGANVTADTMIMSLVNPELEADLQKARAAVAGADADVAATRTSLTSQLLDQQAAQAQAASDWQLAQIKARAYRRAYEGGVMSGIDVQESEIAEQTSRDRARIEGERVDATRQNLAAQLRAAEAGRDEAAIALDIAERQVESLQVRAGIDGILQQVEVEPGQQVEAGAKLARVARPDALIARLQVPELLAKDLAIGLPVRVDTRNGIVSGRLARVDPAVRNGSVAVDVEIEEALPDGARPDLSVDGAILLGTLKNVVSIRRPALAVPGSEGFLFVMRPGEGEAQRVRVLYGPASSERIEIREGMSAGDQAILSDTSRWNDYDSLRIR